MIRSRWESQPRQLLLRIASQARVGAFGKHMPSRRFGHDGFSPNLRTSMVALHGDARPSQVGHDYDDDAWASAAKHKTDSLTKSLRQSKRLTASWMAARAKSLRRCRRGFPGEGRLQRNQEKFARTIPASRARWTQIRKYFNCVSQPRRVDNAPRDPRRSQLLSDRRQPLRSIRGLVAVGFVLPKMQ